MSKKTIFIVFIILTFQLSTIIFGQNELLINVRKNLKNASPFFLDFVQQVFDESDKIAEESGNISYFNVNKVKWVYTDPEYKVFLINKNKYQFYDEESNQLTKGNITENRQKWIWQILFSESITDEITFNNEKKIIYIKNKEDRVDLSVHIGGNGLPRKVIQQQGAGIKYIYFFNNYKTGYKFPENVFDLKLPEDIEIVEME